MTLLNTYANMSLALQAAQITIFSEVTIEIDEGEIPLPPAEALEAFSRLAPGEGFSVISATSTDGRVWTWSGAHWINRAVDVTPTPAEDPDEPAFRKINRDDYTDRLDQILAALALVDDLQQDAYDHGQPELAARLHTAYDDLERFRVMPKPIRPGDTVTRGSKRGIVTNVIKHRNTAGVMLEGDDYPIRVSMSELNHAPKA